ncbi:LysR family transcriptional regulator [Pseudomonas gingeri]|uniref:LysR family transcriptional regulator n=1 Tax=Pseudomonas gingeri TaxID=117681 RepID=UPI0015A13EB1|nr:LysR family transcriptional regulator [Pseudomonas gingeri]NVZ65413.1 LysR family transcriptional regulator [Pseudomonas gingeri]NVZ77663.1 LysR family transcriptional regulator [Pseudomonas gingeri]
MYDLDLLKTFVCVIDAGGFTKGGERVNRTQSTVSQQIRKLEDQVGRALLVRHRACKEVQLTEDGERLMSYARRLVLLASEAQAVMQSGDGAGLVRLGVPEDFDVQRMMQLLSGFAGRHPRIRLDTVNGLSLDLKSRLANDDLDLALIKRNAGEGTALASWPEELVWVSGTQVDVYQTPLPLVVYAQGCIYRNRLIHTLESQGRAWRIAFSSQSLAGIQAAVSANLGISLLPRTAVLAGHRELSSTEGFGLPPASELALVSADRTQSQPQRLLIEYLLEQLHS